MVTYLKCPYKLWDWSEKWRPLSAEQPYAFALLNLVREADLGGHDGGKAQPIGRRVAGSKDVPGSAGKTTGAFRDSPNACEGAAGSVEHWHVADGKFAVVGCIGGDARNHESSQSVAHNGVKAKSTEKEVPPKPMVAPERSGGTEANRTRTPVSC